MNQYRNLGYKIAGYPCVTMRSVNRFGKVFLEHTLAGEMGEIWHYGGEDYRAYSVRAGRKSEKLKYLKLKDLKKFKDKLKIPFSADAQVFWANNPNSRLK